MKNVHFELLQLVDLLNGALTLKSAQRVRRELAEDIAAWQTKPTQEGLLSLIRKSGRPKFVQWEIVPAEREFTRADGKVVTHTEPRPSFSIGREKYVIRQRW